MKRHIHFVLFSGLLFLIGLPGLLAQETPPPLTEEVLPTPEPPTETPSPTVTLTETPSETPSETAAIIVSESPTAQETTASTVSLSPGATLFETPTETPTALLTSTVEASATPTSSAVPPVMSVYLEDRFENLLDHWNIPSDVSIINFLGTGNSILIGNTASMLRLNEQNFYNVVVEANLWVFYGTGRLSVRHSSVGNYAVTVDVDGWVSLYRAGNVVASAFVGQTPLIWQKLRLSAIEGEVTVWANGAEIIQWFDDAPLPPGEATFSADDLTSATVVDDVTIWIPTDELSIRPVITLVPPGITTSARSLFELANASGNVSLAYANCVGDCEIFVTDPYNPISTNTFQVTNNNYPDTTPAISPDGMKIAFASDPDNDGVTDIYVMNSSNNYAISLVITNGRNPAWSPDGTKLAFDRNSEIYYANSSNGNNEVRVTNNSFSDFDPTWSPNGARIAFTTARPANNIEIYTVNINNGNEVNISNSTAIDTSANWSGNNQIVFTSNRSGNDDLHVHTISSGMTQNITNSPGIAEYAADWSPDNTEIAFSRGGAIYRMSASGGTQTLILSNGIHPSWSNPFPLPTPTPSPTPTPGACSATTYDVGSLARVARFRMQPMLYSENWIFQLPAGTLPLNVTMFNSLWWPDSPGGSSLTITSIDLIAYIGAIGWVDPDVPWYQVQVDGITNTGTVSLTGYLQARNVNGQAILNISCSGATSLGTPTPEPGLPQITPVQFAVSPRAALFNGHQPPAVMGSFGLHEGSNPSIFGSTIDIVPRNIELCIDSHSGSLSECDPSASGTVRIPVYAPASGCATYSNGQKTIEINIDRRNTSGVLDCNAPNENGDRQIVLTHIRNQMGASQKVVSAGEYIGTLCRHSERTSACDIPNTQPVIPTHLAFQLRLYPPMPGTKGNLGTEADVEREVLGFLAVSRCLYDDWADVHSSPTQQTYPFHACP